MKKNKAIRWTVTILIILVLFGSLAFLAVKLLQNKQQDTPTVKEPPSYTLDGFAMDTTISQILYGDADGNLDQAKKIANENMQLLQELENKLSMYVSGSEISQINDKAGLTEVKRVNLSDDTYALLSKAKEYGKQTKGLFDVTIGPLTSLWNITGDNPRVPSQEEIDTAKSYVDYRQISLDDKAKAARLQKPYMKLDLGGIAKGYACDRLKAKLQADGVDSALISLGGNVLAWGKKPGGEDFSIGLRNPFSKNADDLVGKLTAPNKILATTGAYERSFEQDGKTYHHVLDPRTGYPCETDLASVTVVSEDGTLADMLSTTFYIAGKKTALEHLNSHPEFALILVDNQKNVYLSDSLKNSFTLTEGLGFKLAEGN